MNISGITAVFGGLLLLEAAGVSLETGERMESSAAARTVATRTGKPVLNIGCPRITISFYPCGDTCLDISRERLAVCRSGNPTYGDIRAMPFRDKEFGAVCCFHVLEHLYTVEDARKALSELHRVADRVYVCSPKRWHPYAWLHPEHNLWVDHLPDGSLRFEQR